MGRDWTPPTELATELPASANGQAPGNGGIDLDRLAAIAARYAPVDWRAAWDNQPESVDWLYEPILERGTINALFGKPAAGKSLITLEIVLRLVRAGHVVTYVDDENRVTDLVERLQAFGAAPDELGRLRCYSFAGLPPLDTIAGGVHLLALAVTAGAALVVLDTTSRMVQGKENDADTFIQLYRCALVPLKSRGITVLRLDHPGRDESRGQRGSSAKDGDVDTIWWLTEEAQGRRYRLRRTKSRSGHGDLTELPLQRLYNPLRHELSPGDLSGVTELCGQLERLQVPPDAGRDRCRTVLKQAGIQAGNDLLTAAIRHRKTVRGQPGDSSGRGAEVSACPSVPLIGTDRRTAPDPAEVTGG